MRMRSPRLIGAQSQVLNLLRHPSVHPSAVRHGHVQRLSRLERQGAMRLSVGCARRRSTRCYPTANSEMDHLALGTTRPNALGLGLEILTVSCRSSSRIKWRHVAWRLAFGSYSHQLVISPGSGA